MNIKELIQFTKEYDIKLTQKLVKYLIIIGISAMKSKTSDISIETIKLIASSCKQLKLKSGLAQLKQKVMNIEQSMSPKTGTFNFFEDNKLKRSKSPLIESQFSPIQKKQERVNNKPKKAISIQEQEFIHGSMQMKKENEFRNDQQFYQQIKSQQLTNNKYNSPSSFSKKLNIDQIATNFLSSPLIKHPLTARNMMQSTNELQYFFQNANSNWKQF